MEQFCYTIAPDQDGQRVDSFLASLTGRTRSQIQHYMEQGLVTIENRTAAKNSRVKTGQTVVISVPDPVELEACPQEIPVEILYEDDCVLVVNKPKGMVVHPAPGNPDGTLVNALLWHCKGHLSSINGVIRPGIVHRIDRDTSGLLLVAKTDQAHLSLSAQIAAHSCERVYQAFSNKWNSTPAVYVATGDDFADGLVAAANAAAYGPYPLALVNNNNVETANYIIASEGVASEGRIFVFGGTAAVSNELVQEIVVG